MFTLEIAKAAQVVNRNLTGKFGANQSRESKMTQPKVLAFINYKGGVAKTTSAYHIGCWLADTKGKRVLLIDIDPQTNLTFLCASVRDWEIQKSNTGTIASMYKNYLDGSPINAQQYIWTTPIRLRNGRHLPRLDLIPCDIELIGADIGTGMLPTKAVFKEQARQFVHDRRFLSDAIDEVRDNYDYIIIDCPPNLYLMTQNALMASGRYIVTAIPDHLSTIGLTTLNGKVSQMKDIAAKASSIAGLETRGYAEFGAVLFVRVRIGGDVLTTAHADKMVEVRNRFKCFDSHTTELIGYTEAAANSVPVWFHHSENARRASNKQEYPRVVDQLLEGF